MAASSNFCYDLLKKGSSGQESLLVPNPVRSGFQEMKFEEILPKYLQYRYTNQSPDDLIKSSLSLNNCMSFYGLTHALQDVKTCKMIQDFIIAFDPFPLNQIGDFALDTIKFQMEGIKP